MIDWFRTTFENPWLVVVLLTFMPLLELRASIPVGILMLKLPWAPVLLVSILVNIALGPVVYFLLEKFLDLVLRIKMVNWYWQRTIVKTQKKIHPLVEKYGTLGLSVFIGIPLPGSGVYSGAFGGYLLGFSKRRFYLATVFGVIIAAVVVTAVALSGAKAFDFFLKMPESTGH
jgi:uncharacterized membrane protein